MKKFNFKLGPVLNYRTYLERIAQQNAARAHMDVKESARRIMDLNTEKNENTATMNNRLTEGLSAAELQRYFQYDQAVALGILAESARKQELEKVLSEKRRALQKKSVEKKAMELYRDRLKKQYDQAMVLEEQKLMDEIASLKTARKISNESD